ncbi:19888_t:CDS:1, partial [Dentiscutata erythropus]
NRTWSHCGFGEISIPEHESGLSIMPDKVNHNNNGGSSTYVK